MTRQAAITNRGGLRLVHAARAVEARRSIDSVAGFYRRDPAPVRPVRPWLVRLLYRVARPLFWLGYAVLLLGAAWLFGVFVLA